MEAEKRLHHLILARKLLKRFSLSMFALALLFTAGSLYDIFTFTAAGQTDGFPGFRELLAENPDTVAWIRMDGTHIDHPVVQGEDNFEYVDKGFDGNYYQGGAIFLDENNSRDMSDEYIIIHGHHMTGGAMMSDAASYLEEDFFEKNRTGELITTDAEYQLTVIGSKQADAYDSELYYTGPEVKMPVHLTAGCLRKRQVDLCDDDKLVMLSTCSGDMTSGRAVVFCRARKVRRADRSEGRTWDIENKREKGAERSAGIPQNAWKRNEAEGTE